MNTREFQVSTGLTVKTCIECGVRYAIPSKFLSDRRKDHKSFYCPNGHSAYFPQETDEERLEKNLNYTQNRLDSCQIDNRTLDYRARYYKGQLTKLKREARES